MIEMEISFQLWYKYIITFWFGWEESKKKIYLASEIFVTSGSNINMRYLHLHVQIE